MSMWSKKKIFNNIKKCPQRPSNGGLNVEPANLVTWYEIEYVYIF